MPRPQQPSPDDETTGTGAGVIEPPPRENSLRFAGRPAFWSLGVFLAALLVLRRPECLLHPQFWAEDGTIFFQQAFNEGFWTTVLRPANGYQHLFPRLAAGLALLFPLERAPLIFNLVALVVQVLPALYLLGPRMAAVVPSFPVRVLAALLYIATPASSETHVNLTNSQWSLALTTVCILVAAPAPGVLPRVLETFVVLLFSLTGPFSFLFLPLVAPRLLGAFKGAPRDHSLTIATLIAAGAVIQAGSALTSARVVVAAGQWDPLSFQELLTVFSLHAFFNPVFGMNSVAKVNQSMPQGAHWLGLFAVTFLLFVAVRDRVRPLLILFYLATATIALAFAFPLNDPRIWLFPQAGPRYFLFSCLFLLFALLHVASTRGRLRSPGIALLAATIAVGIPADFRHPEQPDVHWADNVAVLRSLPAGSDFSIPVTPLYHAGMVLHKKSSRREPSPLFRLRPIRTPTPADVAISRPERLYINRTVNESMLSVAGWAIDGAARDSAGGVFIRIDDKLFPAVYGLRAQITVDGRPYPDCGFTRLIPIAEIGPGEHELSIVVVSRDRGGYYAPTSPRLFTTSRFFP